MVHSVKIVVAVLLLVGSFAVCSVSNAFAASKEVYDIIYILTNDLERVLDYKEELESIFDVKGKNRIKEWQKPS